MRPYPTKPHAAEASEAIGSGAAEVLVDNGTFDHRKHGLVPCKALPPRWRVPAGVAVAKGNTAVADR